MSKNGIQKVYTFYNYTMGYLILLLAIIYSIICYLKVTIFIREYKSFALKNKGKLYLTGIALPINLIVGGLL